MKQMKAAPPAALAHLRDGAVAAENPALARAIADLRAGRIGGLVAFFAFPRGGREPLLYYYKRIKECCLLAERLAPLHVPLDVTVGDPAESLGPRMLRHDARILFVAPDAPAPDPRYLDAMRRLRDFDLVEVPGRAATAPPSIPPYWRLGLDPPGDEDEVRPSLANRFLADPLALRSDIERLETASALRRLLAEEA